VSDHDAVVIGAGSAGLTVAVGLAGLGRRVALVESGAVGGDCTNTGCIPSKTLIHLAGRPDPPGDGSSVPHGAAVLAQVRRRRDELARRERVEIPAVEGIELVEGTAVVSGTGPGIVDVTGDDGTIRSIRAPHVVIATGARPRRLPIDGLPDELALTNETVFEQRDLPRHLVVVGGGAVGIELACAVHRLGSRVTVVTRGASILSAQDRTATAVLTAAVRSRGIDVRTGVTPTRFVMHTGALELSDGSAVAGVDRVLVAVGRSPRVEGLGLEGLDVEVTTSGITTDDVGGTGVPGLWAVGDVTAHSQTTHGANAYGRRVVQAIAFPRLPAGRRPVVPTAVFSDPEVASVGLDVAEIERRWPASARRRIEIDLTTVDRAFTDDVTHGVVIVDAERFTGRILRATIVGPHASESIGIVTLAVQRRVSLHRLYRLVHPYPTYASALGKAADEFARQTLPHLPREGAAWCRSRLPVMLRRYR
jgi:dihydrolipoamide dehydrogenase